MDKICPKPDCLKLSHIRVVCQICGCQYDTKNIDYIGARNLFPVDRSKDCEHSISDLAHICLLKEA